MLADNHTATIHALGHIGWRSDTPVAAWWQAQQDVDATRVVRVISQHRTGYEVHDGHAVFKVFSPAAWHRRGFDPTLKACVGDWVLLDEQRSTVAQLLPRHTLLKRSGAGERQVVQNIAANIDTVFIVCGLDEDFNLKRLDRYRVLVANSGAQSVPLFTKADMLSDDGLAWRREQFHEFFGDELRHHFVNAHEADTLAVIDDCLTAGQTTVLVGSSGAGKSTLTNTLMGEQVQQTGAVRDRDARGRHTTVSKHLLTLPGGACLIDTPGMRELALSGDESLADSFADIHALAAHCKFNDCRHQKEPGCAVRQALEEGKLTPERLAHFHKLADELKETQDAITQKRRRKDHMPRHLK